MPFIYPQTNYYADWNAPDWTPSRGDIPLSDFFSTNNQRIFTSISTPYDADWFEDYYQETGDALTGPDGTSGDED